MAITLDENEVADFLTKGHTIIVSSVGKDGYPHVVPSWYCYFDGHVYLRGRAKAQKTKNLLRNPRVSVLVESGEYWKDLKAVMIRGRAEPVQDAETQNRIQDSLWHKYLPFRTPGEKMPERVQQHYGSTTAYFRVIPEKKTATWDNAKIRLKA